LLIGLPIYKPIKLHTCLPGDLPNEQAAERHLDTDESTAS